MAGRIKQALDLLKAYPRVSLGNLKPPPFTITRRRNRRGQHGGYKRGMGQKGQKQRGSLPYIGHEGGQTPFHIVIPKEPYYQGYHAKKQYPPLTLLQIQRMIDLGLLNPNEPIDLPALLRVQTFQFKPRHNHYGLNLTDEGIDSFEAQINLEIQWASEPAIAAIERLGGTITTRFYDMDCLNYMLSPRESFLKGIPIPRCKLPSNDVVKYYTGAENRGYLADPEKIAEERAKLAQKYGYELPDLKEDPKRKMLMKRKDPRQIFFDLRPGWVVNLHDRCILKPTDEELLKYYSS